MNFKELPDELLIHGCRTGNVKAFDVLFERYFHKLHFFTLKYIKDECLTEEMVMDLMTKLWERKDIFNTAAPLEPYLFRAMKNKIIDHYRRKTLATVVLDKVEERHLIGNSTDDQFCLKELQIAYQSNLEKLSPQRRRVFEMSRHEQLTYPQIAKHLNLSVKTVESHISAALVYLRKSLHNYIDGFLVIAFLILFH